MTDVDKDDTTLVRRAIGGDGDALEQLVQRHQTWVYNVAVRMLGHPHDAEDATQDIFIKAMTRLASFQGRSTFETWLYRIAVNHILNMKRGRLEQKSLTFSCYAHGLDSTPDQELPDRSSVPVDVRLLVKEARISCTSGMLLCLDRGQRLVYILGEILDIGDAVGAELLEISPDNFRQRLSRARRDLHSFMNDKCGLVNAANPCRCAKKTRAFMDAGYVDASNLLFADARVRQVRDVAPATARAVAALDEQCARIYREHSFYEPPDIAQALRRLIDSSEFRRAVDLS